ncbi:MAG: efflux RND transporter permease subunit [Gammaproteobacteria bacterium]|nr:efflux RND transporter permease subunit [Gammaproteobacteria bacterium]MBT8150071.1 efflux RND transporter permease subunit [Gammaproteobacteria bacterium]NND40096.1 efflux RND transporter permease subunit [Pseudomonadales bacterium]NNL11707.1 efflux RND transporter permease subunit [Pseudomonadales bacterium]NNM12438.1 efflux RND transporter permease subunit [Pseudomonadales bacterium]
MKFIDNAISRTRTTMLLMFMVIFCGVFARNAIPIAGEPNVDLPFFYVGMVHEGISPEDAERLLIEPMELEIRKIEGVAEINSLAAEGIGTTFVEFEIEQGLNEALFDLREAVDRAKAELPSDAEEPFIKEIRIDNFPMIQVNLLGENVDERSVYQAALALRDEIETIPSVLSADLQGHREELLEVIIDPEALEAYRITSEQLINTLQRNNRLIPAGSIDTGLGRFAVKVPSLVEEASDVLELPIVQKGDAVITLGDIATVQRTFKDRTAYSRFNGRNSITIAVKKKADGNIVSTADEVVAIVDAARARVPAGIDLVISHNQAEFSREQVSELQGNIVTALALVMVLVVAVMGVRSGLIVGLGIPVSLLFSVIIIYLLGYTFNFMVMFGMLLGLGMLIDGAIVVTEYADRQMADGMDHRKAYAAAVKRMFWPVVASTATTLAAFLPLMFWPGVSGQFMSYLPITVFTVLVGSLFYALLFGPVLGTLFGKPRAHREEAVQMHVLETGDPASLKTFTGRYARFLGRVTARPIRTLLIIFGLLAGIFVSYDKFGAGMIFFSEAEPQYLQVSVRARGNYSASEVNELVKEVEGRIIDVDGLRAMNTQTLSAGVQTAQDSFTDTGSSDRIGSFFIELLHEQQRDIGGFEVMREIRRRTESMPGIQVDVFPFEGGPPVGKSIQIEMRSRDRALLEPALARLSEYMQSLPGLVDIDDTLALPSIEWRLQVDRVQAAIYGADVVAAGVAVQLVTNGVKVDEYRPAGAEDSVDIRVRFPRHERGIKALERLRINTNQGLVPISNFVSMRPAQGVDTAGRTNGVPVERVRAEVEEGYFADAKLREIQEWIDQQTFDPAIEIIFRGANEEQSKSIAFVQLAFLLSLMLMFVLLVTQFNSFYQSTLILLAVVMSTAGVLLGLIITGNAFSAVLTGVGVVALAGIVVNNNIVLIDTFNHVRDRHPELNQREVIVRASAQRLRPVLLTTLTTVFGLLPLACGLSVNLVHRSVTASGSMSMMWEPLSQAIVFGLSFATILTLIATPAMLALPVAGREKYAAWQAKRDQRVAKGEQAAAGMGAQDSTEGA